MPATALPRALLVVLLLAPALVARAPASAPASAPAEPLPDGKVLFRQYYLMQLDGKKVGRMFSKAVERPGPGGPEIASFTGVRLEIGRGTTTINLGTSATVRERPDGTPLGYDYHEALGTMGVHKRGVFRPGPDGRTVIGLTVEQAGQVLPEQVLAWDPAALMPYASLRKLMALTPKVGDQVQWVVFSAELPGTPYAPVTFEFLERGTVELFGSVHPGWKIRSRVLAKGLENMVTEGWYSEQFDPLKVTTAVGGMTITMMACSEAVAKGPNEPLEMMMSSMIQPSRPLPDPRRLEQADYILRLRSVPLVAPELPSTDLQTVEPLAVEAGQPPAWKVRLRRQPMALKPTGRSLSDADRQTYLAASSLVNWKDEQVAALAREWQAGATDPVEIANRMVNGVRQSIRLKNLGVGFATASETARTRTGDCTEHAVLLVAALRAAGIPARGVTGLVYVDQFAQQRNVFGYHMWAQAYLAGQWVDLDAALPNQARPDATHIALGVASLNDDGPVGEMAAIIPVISNLSIEVVNAAGPGR